jgi:hypothetical protein
MQDQRKGSRAGSPRWDQVREQAALGLLRPTPPLTANDSARLAELESTIKRGLRTFVEVGKALAEIRHRRLYRESHSTFEAYCRERWDFSDSRARQLIGVIEGVVTTVTAAGLPTPSNERQARELLPLKDDKEALIETWRDLSAKHGEALTAQVVHERVAEKTAERDHGGNGAEAEERPKATCPTCHRDIPGSGPIPSSWLKRKFPEYQIEQALAEHGHDDLAGELKRRRFGDDEVYRATVDPRSVVQSTAERGLRRWAKRHEADAHAMHSVFPAWITPPSGVDINGAQGEWEEAD